MEKKLQTEIIKWLKAGGAYVIKTRPQAGVPYGCPDIIALYHSRHADIEVKASLTAPYQPGQKETLQRLGEHNINVYSICPENWPQAKVNLEKHFFQSAYGK